MGITVIVLLLSPLFHWYVPPPVAVSVEEFPSQIVEGDALILAEAVLMFTVTETDAVHPFVMVTV